MSDLMLFPLVHTVQTHIAMLWIAIVVTLVLVVAISCWCVVI
jgi:hypothetical protein